jgi:hypothetical protein
MEILEPEKFSQLRAKTDRQLLDFVHSKLEAGQNLAALAETLYSIGNRASAECSLERADQALNDVQMLLPVMSGQQRRELDPKLNKLRETLERLGLLHQSPITRTASSMM